MLCGSRQQRAQWLLAAAAVPVLPSGGSAWAQLTSNYVFCVGFWGWFMAQFLKVGAEWLAERGRATRQPGRALGVRLPRGGGRTVGTVHGATLPPP